MLTPENENEGKHKIKLYLLGAIIYNTEYHVLNYKMEKEFNYILWYI